MFITERYGSTALKVFLYPLIATLTLSSKLHLSMDLLVSVPFSTLLVKDHVGILDGVLRLVFFSDIHVIII